MLDGNVFAESVESVQLPVSEPRKLRFRVFSSGVSIMVGSSADDAVLIYSGMGYARVSEAVEGDQLFLVPWTSQGIARLDIPELRNVDPEAAGWTNEESLTDLSPRPYGMISPEIQAVMDRMNRNAIIREQALLRSLGQAGNTKAP